MTEDIKPSYKNFIQSFCLDKIKYLEEENKRLTELLNRSNVRLSEEQLHNEELKGLKKENNNLKEQLYCCKQNVFAELNQETAESNEYLLQKIADLEEQINKMKRCYNCKFSIPICDVHCEDCDEHYSNWELAE